MNLSELRDQLRNSLNASIDKVIGQDKRAAKYEVLLGVLKDVSQVFELAHKNLKAQEDANKKK